MVKSDLERSGLKQFIFPGWGMPLDIYSPYLGLGQSSEILDFGFFGDKGLAVDFSGWKFETDSDCFIIGHSLGGLLALKAAADCGRVKALVLFAPFARFTEDAGYSAQPAEAVEKMALQLDKNPKGLLKSFHRRMGFSCDIPEKINVDALRAGLNALKSLDIRGMLSGIDVPALVICGGNDLIVSGDMSDLVVGSLKKSSCVLLDDSGHAIPFSCKERCIELIVEFLKDTI